MKQYYTKKEYESLIKDMTVLYDTREQENSHIIDWLSKKHIQSDRRALKLGDYSFRIGNEWYVDEVFIERKNSLDELAQSILSERFHREMKLASTKQNKYLIIENGSWEDILEHNYQSKYDPKAFWNTLHTFESEYDLKIKFIKNKELMGQVIFSICKSVLNRHVLHG